jgi:hypothetical protein
MFFCAYVKDLGKEEWPLEVLSQNTGGSRTMSLDVFTPGKYRISTSN